MADDLLADLTDERAELRSLLAGLAAEDWLTPTPSAPWTVRDQVAHLAFFDLAAVVAATDPDAFRSGYYDEAVQDPDYTQNVLARVPADGAEALAWWDEQAQRFDEVYGALPAGTRVPWLGPAMSGPSMTTARLMETWAHGQDVRDALGAPPSASARLRHVAWLALRARPYVYMIRSRSVPDARIRLELVAPDGSEWRIGDEDAEEAVRGSALEFCLVLTQRRNVADTALVADGAAAREWLEIGQAFAGPAGPGRAAGSGSDLG